MNFFAYALLIASCSASLMPKVNNKRSFSRATSSSSSSSSDNNPRFVLPPPEPLRGVDQNIGMIFPIDGVPTRSSVLNLGRSKSHRQKTDDSVRKQLSSSGYRSRDSISASAKSPPMEIPGMRILD